jgi:hypothetical protein
MFGVSKVKVGLLVIAGLLVPMFVVGCGNDSAPPGPAVGSKTPTGGVISAEGRKSPGPHMMKHGP